MPDKQFATYRSLLVVPDYNESGLNPFPCAQTERYKSIHTTKN